MTMGRGTKTVDMLQGLDAAPGARFDYEQMDDGAANEAKAAVERYRARSKAYFLDTGRDLLAVKARTEHGLFLKWVEAEMGITPRTAQNLMQAATQLGHKSEIISHLPPTTLYTLAAPSTPEPIRAEVVRRLEAGERLEPRVITGIVRAAKTEARQRKIEDREAARFAGLTDEQRAAEQKDRLTRAKRKELREAQLNREADERAARDKVQALAAEEAAALLSEKMGTDLRRFLNLVQEAGWPARVIQRADTLDRLKELRGR